MTKNDKSKKRKRQIYPGDRRYGNPLAGRHRLKGNEPKVNLSTRIDADVHRALIKEAKNYSSVTECLEVLLKKALGMCDS